MKIRWTTSSIRGRITPTELFQLSAGIPLQAALFIPGCSWTFRVIPGCSVSALHCDQAVVSIEIDDASLALLADPNSEGVYFRTEEGFRYLIEKDFPCAHPHSASEGDDDSERFPPTPSFEQRKILG